jgi:hypothetical protein
VTDGSRHRIPERHHPAAEVDHVVESLVDQPLRRPTAAATTTAHDDHASTPIEFGDPDGQFTEWDVDRSRQDTLDEFFGLADVDELRAVDHHRCVVVDGMFTDWT